jgi:hypothetical protein
MNDRTAWNGVTTNTLLMILGDFARANDDMLEADQEPYEWQIGRDALIDEIDRHGDWMRRSA